MTTQHTIGQYLRGALLGGTLLAMTACGSQAATGTEIQQQPKQATTLETVVEATPPKAPVVSQRPKHAEITVQPLGVEHIGPPHLTVSIAYKDEEHTYRVVHCIPSVQGIPGKYFDEKMACITDVAALIEAHQKTGEGGVHLVGYQTPDGGIDTTMIAVDGLSLPCAGR